MPEARAALSEVRAKLATVWFTGSGIVFVVLMLQSIFGKYAGQLQEVWSWFVPTVVPSLSLMLGVIGASALSAADDDRMVKATFYRFALALSYFYLVVLALTIFLEPLGNVPGIQLFILSNYWLSPIQGLVVAAIGVVFATQEKGVAGDSRQGNGGGGNA